MPHRLITLAALSSLAITTGLANGCIHDDAQRVPAFDAGAIDVDGAIPDASTPDTGVDSGVPDTGTDAGAPETGADAGGGTLWVTDDFGGTSPGVLAFSVTELAAGGDVAPKTTISGATTTLTGPGCVAFDGSGNLWVVDSPGSKQAGKILEFAAASVAAGGDIAPTQTISGANTTLTNPSGCAFDSSGALWIANIDSASQNVVAFSAAQLATGGNIAPAIALGGGCNTIDVAFDGTGNLWVANLCTGLQEFTKADLATSGTPTPVVSIGQATGVSSITFDSAGNLWTSLQGGVNGVTEFTAGSLADAGTPVATLQISGTGTAMSTPFGVTFANGNLWVAQQASNALTQFDVAGLADGGGLAPTALASGAGTKLSSPSFILFH